MNLSEIREKLQKLNKKGNKGNDVWKPKDEHEVRLLPYPHGSDSFIELYFHYEIGDVSSVLCPRMNFGKECVICEFCAKLAAWKDPDGNDKKDVDKKADWELFKKIQPKARVFIPMIERTKEADGVKFWGVTPNQCLEILKVCEDGDRMAEVGLTKNDSEKAIKVIFDPDRAYDLHVSFAKPGEKGNAKPFGLVTITGKIKACPVSNDKKAQREILASVKNIKEAYPEVPSAEVEKIFNKFVHGAQPEAKPEGGVEKYPESKANTKEDAAKSGTRTVDEAFGDLLDSE